MVLKYSKYILPKLIASNIHLYQNEIIRKAFNIDLKDCKHYDIVVLQGGGDSGKTVAVLQYLNIIASYFDNESVLIASQTVPHLKRSGLKAFVRYVKRDFDIYIKSYNKTDREVLYHTNSSLVFSSFQDSGSSVGSEYDYAYFNEANYMGYDTFFQVFRKLKKQFILDYNPASKFWVHEKLLSPNREKMFEGKILYIQTDHRHNPFLDKRQHDLYESISDPELFKVYARGETGQLKGLIFKATEVDDFPNDVEKIIWGVDYGYTVDPTCIIKIGIKGNNRYIHECFYQPCGDPNVIYEAFIAAGYKDGDLVFSEHDKEIKLKLAMKGIRNIYNANKSNKVANVAIVKRYNLFYTKSSLNYKSEIDAYLWVTTTNLTTGEEIAVAILPDGNDHAIDAKIYGIATHARVFENVT